MASSVTPSLGSFKIENPSLENRKSLSPQERIAAGFSRGLFDPFKDQLSLKDYFRETLWTTIQNLVTSCKEHEKNEILLYSLFTVGIDPNLTDEEKKTHVAEVFSSLGSEQAESVAYYIGNAKPFIAIHILRFCPKELWQRICPRVTQFGSFEGTFSFVHWIREVSSNDWTKDEKQQFLNQLFDCLPPDLKDDSLYLFLAEANPATQENFFAIAQPELASHTLDLKLQVTQAGEQFLTNPLKRSAYPSFKRSQQVYFLHWFFENKLEHPNADMVGLRLDEENWERLKKLLGEETKVEHTYNGRSEHRIIPATAASLRLKWMTSIAQRSQDPTFLADFENTCCLFYRYASNGLNRSNCTLQAVEAFANNLTPRFLYQFASAINYSHSEKKCLQNQLLEILLKDPSIILQWIQLSAYEKPERGTNQEKVSEIFHMFSTFERLEPFFSIVFRSTPYFTFSIPSTTHTVSDQDYQAIVHQTLEATIYSSLDTDLRFKVLTHIKNKFQSNEKLISILTQWTCCLLASQEESPALLSYFAKGFMKTLEELDPNLPLALQQALQQALTPLTSQSTQACEYISELLPLSQDPKEIAVSKVQKLLMNPEPYTSAANVTPIRLAYKELGRYCSKDSSLFPLIIDSIPEKVWPLAVKYFFEECSWGVPQRRHNGSVAKEEKCNETEKWTNILSKSFLNCIDNPLVEEESVIRDLYRVSKGLQVTQAVLQYAIKECRRTQFIQLINLIGYGRYFGPDEKKSLLSQLAQSLKDSEVNPIDFIAKSIIGFSSIRDVKTSSISLEDALLEAPFLNTPAEQHQVVVIIINQMGFVWIFQMIYSRKISIGSFIQILKADKPAWNLFFRQALLNLTSLNNNFGFKLVVFQRLFSSYVQASSLSQIKELLDHPELSGCIVEIRNWYSSDRMEDSIKLSKEALFLLLSFTDEEKFYAYILRQIEQTITKETSLLEILNLNELFSALDKLSLLPELPNRIKIEHVLERCETKHPDLVVTIKQTLADLVESALDCTSLFPLLQRWVPDWDSRIAKVLLQKIQGCREASFYHYETSYYDCNGVYENLHKLKQSFSQLDPLTHVHQLVKQQAPESLQEYVDQAFAQFLAQLEKKAEAIKA